jgi:F-type H+-transporting ATPase subunit b
MGILIQLGVNETLAIQLGLFLVVFVVLKHLLFGPYFAALMERRARTLGKTEQAEKYVAEARVLEDQYAMRAREANDMYRDAFEKGRLAANKEFERVVGEARQAAKDHTDAMRDRLGKEMVAVRSQLSQEVASVSQVINQKLIGKEITA